MYALVLLEMKNKRIMGTKRLKQMSKQQSRDLMPVSEHVNWNQGVGCPKNQRGLLSALSSRLQPAVIGSQCDGTSPGRNLGSS